MITTFRLETPDATAASAENAADTLPAPPPLTDTLTTSVPCTPDAPRHSTLDDDTHSLHSQLDTPTRLDPLTVNVPRSPPLTLTTTPPVDAPFRISTPDTLAPSYVIPSDTLPTSTPALTDTRSVPDTPLPDLHATELSDAHSLDSHADPPTPAPALDDANPNPLPTTTTDAPPVPATFTRAAPLTYLSTEYASLTLPTSPPDVTTTRSVPDTPPLVRHTTLVSDTHTLASHPLTPTPTRPLYPLTPSPVPLTLTLTLPLPTAFARSTLDPDHPS